MFMDKKPSQLQSTNIHASKQLIMTHGMAPQLTPQLEPTQCLQGQGQGQCMCSWRYRYPANLGTIKSNNKNGEATIMQQ